MGRLEGQRVLVIGGSSGMGYSISEAVVDEGGDLAIVARGQTRLDDAAKRLEARCGRSVMSWATPIEDRQRILAIIEEFSPIDHLILPGSTVQPMNYSELDETSAEAAFGSKFWGPFWTVFDARSRMRPGGSIVMFAGVASRRPVPGYVIGACINGAIEAGTRSLALELGPLGLRINTISPGFVMTPLFGALHDPDDVERRLQEAERRLPVGRVGEPEEAASVAMMFMTNGFVTGQVLVLDGGLLSTN